MEHPRELRAFSVYRAEPTLFTEDSLVETISKLASCETPRTIGHERVFVRVGSVEDNIIDSEIIWDTEEEILVSQLSESGDLVETPLRFRNAIRMFVWLFDGSPYVFVFMPMKQPKFMTVLGELLQVTFQRVVLKNSFFHQLLNHPRTLSIREGTFRSGGEGIQEFTISGPRSNPASDQESQFRTYMDTSELWDVTLVVRGLLNRKSFPIRVTRQGRIHLLTSLDPREIRLFAYDIHHLLIQEGGDRGEE